MYIVSQSAVVGKYVDRRNMHCIRNVREGVYCSMFLIQSFQNSQLPTLHAEFQKENQSLFHICWGLCRDNTYVNNRDSTIRLYYVKVHLFKTLRVFRTLRKLLFVQFLIFLPCIHKACGLNFCHWLSKMKFICVTVISQ
jgi:hypothetical protein